MIKFFIVLFLVGQNGFRYVGQTEVATASDCIDRVLQINTTMDNPYTAFCFVNKIEPKPEQKGNVSDKLPHHQRSQ